jgi:YqaJ-like viral recombinase domain
MIEYNVEQGSPEWFGLRLGRPTASEFSRILTPAKADYSAQAAEYIDELIGVKLNALDGRFPPWVEKYTSRDMANGEAFEAEARFWYAMETGNKVRQVGFVTTDDGRFGCSPDGLIDPDGGLELKCPHPSTQMYRLRKGVLPNEYKGQVHGALAITGRKWWDFVSYCHGLPKFMVRVEPDEFTEKLKAALEKFWVDYQEVLTRFGLDTVNAQV